MWWKAVKIAAVIGGGLLALFFIALVIMVSRPALLVGVSGDDLAYSVSGGVGGSEGGSCSKQDDGDWLCGVSGPKARGEFKVDVDWTGCWRAEAVRRPDERHEGCIRLGDVITLEDLGD